MVEQLLHPDPSRRLSLSLALHMLKDELQLPAAVGRTVREENELAQVQCILCLVDCMTHVNTQAQLVVLAAERDFAVHEMRAMAEHCQTVANEFEQLAQHCEILKEQLEEVCNVSSILAIARLLPGEKREKGSSECQ